MLSSSTIIFLVFHAARSVYSQSLSDLGLSQTCSSALAVAIATPNLANCLDVVGAVQIFETTANTSIIQPVDQWVTSVCTAAPCDSSTLSTAATNITKQCASDLAKVGITETAATTVASQVANLYPTLRTLVCLKDTSASNKPFCITELLTDLQNALGKPLSVNNIDQLPAAITGQGGISLPQNLTCSTCTQASWQTIKPVLASFINTSAVDTALDQQCGANFTTTSSLPSNIVEATGTAAAAGSSITSVPSGAIGMKLSLSSAILVGVSAAMMALF